MWISKKKYKEMQDIRKEIEYLSLIVHDIKHNIIELKMGSKKLPAKDTNYQKQKQNCQNTL